MKVKSPTWPLAIVTLEFNHLKMLQTKKINIVMVLVNKHYTHVSGKLLKANWWVKCQFHSRYSLRRKFKLILKNVTAVQHERAPRSQQPSCLPTSRRFLSYPMLYQPLGLTFAAPGYLHPTYPGITSILRHL